MFIELFYLPKHLQKQNNFPSLVTIKICAEIIKIRWKLLFQNEFKPVPVKKINTALFLFILPDIEIMKYSQCD